MKQDSLHKNHVIGWSDTLYITITQLLKRTLNTLFNSSTTMSSFADLQIQKSAGAAVPPHVALFPSAGIGHLVPFLRLAALLASHNSCKVTFIAVQPAVSAAESTKLSSFFSSHPHINRLDFHLPPYIPSDLSPGDQDPFFVQFKAISQSVHLLRPLLASLSPPLSAMFADFVVTAGASHLTHDLSIPFYVVSTTSAKFFSLLACVPELTFETNPKEKVNQNINLPGLAPIPMTSIPPPLFNPNLLFTSLIHSNAPFLPKAKGVIINSFDWLESETVAAVNSGRVLPNLPPFLPVGPYASCEVKKSDSFCHPWLDEQPNESVVYVSFGSRAALSKEQIRELGDGLERSGCRFFWVLKTTIVDKDDKEELQDVLGYSFLQRTKDKGLVHKGWVEQEQILAHPAIGGFVSHCGWNSVIEAARVGVPILAWPQHGDQKVNAQVAEKAGLGLVTRHWGWSGENLVMGEEIGKKVIELMHDKTLRASAKMVKEEARKAYDFGGSSEKVLQAVIEMLST